MNNIKKAKINEIFDSIQGEGPYIGYRQLFIRFCGCNLLCNYCDTEFNQGDFYTVEELLEKIKSFDLEHIHSISLTGGEPLLQYEFLRDFLPEIKKTGIKIYLETNGTLEKPLQQILEFVDIIAMDFKLNSCAKIGDLYSQHENFLEVLKNSKKEVFAKIVFDANIQDFEINEATKLAQKYQISLVLQPKMIGTKPDISQDEIIKIMNKFLEKHTDTRMIGQVHKFFEIR